MMGHATVVTVEEGALACNASHAVSDTRVGALVAFDLARCMRVCVCMCIRVVHTEA